MSGNIVAFGLDKQPDGSLVLWARCSDTYGQSATYIIQRYGERMAEITADGKLCLAHAEGSAI